MFKRVIIGWNSPKVRRVCLAFFHALASIYRCILVLHESHMTNNNFLSHLTLAGKLQNTHTHTHIQMARDFRASQPLHTIFTSCFSGKIRVNSLKLL